MDDRLRIHIVEDDPDVVVMVEQLVTLASDLIRVGETRDVFTSREPLPEPFAEHELVLGELKSDDAVELIRAAARPSDGEPPAAADLASLTEAVAGHAGSLLCLAGEVASVGSEITCSPPKPPA